MNSLYWLLLVVLALIVSIGFLILGVKRWRNALGFAWNFARNRERVGLYLLLILGALVGVGLLCLLFVAVAGNAVGAFGAERLLRNQTAVPALVGGFVVLALLFVFFILFLIGLWLWVSAAIMKSAASEYSSASGASGASGARLSLRECLAFAKTRFWTLVITIILIAIISMLVALPFSVLSLAQPVVVGVFFGVVAFLVRVVLGLAFFFAQYSAVVAETGAVESLRDSVGLFLRSPFDVFLVAMLLIYSAGFLLFLTSIPTVLLALLAVGVAVLVKGAVGLVLGVVIGLIALLVFLIGLSFLEVFLEGFATAAFLDLTGMKSSASASSLAEIRESAFPETARARPAFKRTPAPRKKAAARATRSAQRKAK